MLPGFFPKFFRPHLPPSRYTLWSFPAVLYLDISLLILHLLLKHPPGSLSVGHLASSVRLEGDHERWEIYSLNIYNLLLRNFRISFFEISNRDIDRFIFLRFCKGTWQKCVLLLLILLFKCILIGLYEQTWLNTQIQTIPYKLIWGRQILTSPKASALYKGLVQTLMKNTQNLT